MKAALFSDESAKLLALLVMAAAFLAGAAAGCLAALRLVPGDTLLEYMSAYVGQLAGNFHADWARALFDAFAYPCAVFLLGFTPLGVALIPAAVIVRGFFLGFSVAVYVRMYGAPGLLFAAGSLGLTSLVTLPCLFLLATFGFDSARRLLSASGGTGKQSGRIFGMAYLTRFAICAVLLFASAAYHVFLLGRVMSWLAPLVV